MKKNKCEVEEKRRQTLVRKEGTIVKQERPKLSLFLSNVWAIRVTAGPNYCRLKFRSCKRGSRSLLICFGRVHLCWLLENLTRVWLIFLGGWLGGLKKDLLVAKSLDCLIWFGSWRREDNFWLGFPQKRGFPLAENLHPVSLLFWSSYIYVLVVAWW